MKLFLRFFQLQEFKNHVRKNSRFLCRVQVEIRQLVKKGCFSEQATVCSAAVASTASSANSAVVHNG
jgi:hypothetical protein